jgi:hypothetical protein
MKDLDEAIRDAAGRNEPPADWLERVEARVRRKRRNHRVLAATVGLGLSLAVFVPLALELAASETTSGGAPDSAVAPAPCGISTPLTGWWRWEGSGADEITGRDADLQGDAGFAPGLVGEALTLEGHGDFAAVPDDPALDVGSGDFTVAMWVRFDTTKGEQVLAEKWVQRFDRRPIGWTLTKLRDNSIGFATEGVGGGVGADSAPLNLVSNTWLHFAARRRGDTVQVFLDGAVIASESGPVGDLDSAASLKFGHRGGVDDTPGSESEQRFFLHGQVDEVQLVVGRALSDDEILSLFERPFDCAP